LCLVGSGLEQDNRKVTVCVVFHMFPCNF
jgi:hypothetical protein